MTDQSYVLGVAPNRQSTNSLISCDLVSHHRSACTIADLASRALFALSRPEEKWTGGVSHACGPRHGRATAALARSPLGNAEPRSFVIPGHGAHLPTRGRPDELRRDSPTGGELRVAAPPALVVGA